MRIDKVINSFNLLYASTNLKWKKCKLNVPKVIILHKIHENIKKK